MRPGRPASSSAPSGLQVGARQCEITTFRADRYDRVSRNPEVAYGESLADDLRRRDFTMNAMALSVTGDRAFTDPFGGLADLARGVLRTPGTPEESFADDPLRMLRAARFVSTLGVTLAPEVRAAMTAMAGELARITAERVQAELSKLLLGGAPRAGLEVMVETGLADVVLPELPALRMAADEHGQHKDVYAHTLQVLDQAIDLERHDGPDLVLRWAALLHDVGKPATREFEAGGRVTFHHHEVVGARHGPQAAEGAAVLEGRSIDDVGAAGVPAPALLRLPDAASGPTRRCAAMSSTPARCCPGCTSSSARTARPATSARPRRWPRRYDALEERIAAAARAGGAGRDPSRPGRQRDHGDPRHRARAAGRAGVQAPAGLRMEHGPLGHDRAVEELRKWAADQ